MRRGHDKTQALKLADMGLQAIGKANVRSLDQLVAATACVDHPGAPALMAVAKRQSKMLDLVLNAELG